MWKPSKVELVIGILAVALIGFVAYDWWTEPLVSETNQKKAQEYFEEYKELTDDSDYLPGYASDKIINKLQQALKRDPTRNDIRMELFSIYEQKTGHFANQQEKMQKLLKEGLQVDMAPEKRQELAKAASSYYPNLLNAKSPAEARSKAVDIAPYTDWAIKWRIRFAAIKAKNGKENALSALEEAEEAIRENAERDGTLNESQLRYVQYLKGRYYKKTGNYGKASETYKQLIEPYFSDPFNDSAGIPPAQLNSSELFKETIQLLEKTEDWSYLKKLIENAYTFPDKSFSEFLEQERDTFFRIEAGKLWKKAKDKLEKGEFENE